MSLYLPQSPSAVPSNYGKTGLFQFFSCGAGPAMAAIFTNPMEVSKVRIQMQQQLATQFPDKHKPYKSFVSAMKAVNTESGVKGLQAGLVMSCMREMCKCSLRIGLYLPILNIIHTEKGSRPPVWKSIVAGGACGAISATFCNPLDLLKTRLQQKPGSIAAAGSLLFAEGGLRAFWGGTGVSIMRSVAATASCVPIKYQLQAYVASKGWKADTVFSLAARSAVTAFPAAAAAVACMQPMDTVRTRLYNQGKSGTYRNPLDCARQIIAKEGVLKLWNGALPNFIRFGPHSVLGFIFIDQIQAGLRRYRAHVNAEKWEGEVKDVFQKLDTDGNGVLDCAEYEAGLQRLLGSSMPAGLAQEHFQSDECRNNKGIALPEFKKQVFKTARMVDLLRLRSSFDKLDLTHDGKLCLSELRTFLTEEHASNALLCANKLIEKYDSDGDQQLDFAEFAHLVQEVRNGKLGDQAASDAVQHLVTFGLGRA